MMPRDRLEFAETEHESSLDFRLWRASPHTMRQAHAHPDIEVNLLLTGCIRYFMGGQFYALKKGETALFWAGMPHQCLVKNSVSGVWMTLPLVWLLRWKHAAALAGRLL